MEVVIHETDDYLNKVIVNAWVEGYLIGRLDQVKNENTTTIWLKRLQKNYNISSELINDVTKHASEIPQIE